MTYKTPKLTFERLQELLSYEPETGIFRWKIRPTPRIRPGSVAGTVRPDGYREVRFEGFGYLSHRIAWLYMTREWPTQEIDHINGVRGDNRFANLREATRFQNTRNTGLRRDNKTGVKGVEWRPYSKRFIASIRLNGKRCYLGSFASLEEAKETRELASKKLHGDYFRSP